MTTKAILVAEDNLVNQQVVIQMLSRLGHAVAVVNNGKKAVEAALTGKYDLVFMDVMMPVLDGLSATIEIREFERPALRVPIVALTAIERSRRMNEIVSMPEWMPSFQNRLLRSNLKSVSTDS
jgi:CheY-like chemotaxis protein